MSNTKFTIDQRIKKLEIESDWRHRQIGVLIDSICSVLTYEQRMRLYDQLDAVYNQTMAQIDTNKDLE